MNRPRVVIGTGVAPSLARFCAQRGYRRLALVADANTWPALGQAVEASLRNAGLEVQPVILRSAEVVADAHHILEVLLALDRPVDAFLAAGSGTITDITRFVSHRTHRPFIALPTAPSVDGFTSLGSPLIVRGVKTTALAHAPSALFADLGVLRAAPRAMIAAGVGDMLGKYTSVADWRLARLLWDLPYDETIAARSLSAARASEAAVSGIAEASEEGIRSLLEALLESGFCMGDFGSSLPASGAEHHISHFWEMKLLNEGRPGLLHGAKVGVATVFVAGLYEKLGQLTVEKAQELLARSGLPAREKETDRIRRAYGPMTEEVLRTQASFLDMDAAGYDRLKRRILGCWSDIQEIARQVPGPGRLAGILRRVGGPANVRELGLSDPDLELAADTAYLLRNHFTVCRLVRILFPGGKA